MSSSSITHLNTKSRTFSTSTTSSTSAPASPTTTTSSSSSNDSHTQNFLDKTIHKVKSFVPQHHHQSKKPYPQPPTDVPQQPPQHRTSTDSMHGIERRPTVTMYGRHSNEWLFGGVSVRKVVGGFFQHED